MIFKQQDFPVNSSNTGLNLQSSQAILDALTPHVAVVDENGFIIAVNRAWKEFADMNGCLESGAIGIGANYLKAAREATGPWFEEGPAACEGIKSVLDGLSAHFTLEYPCHSPTEQRWFLLTATPLAGTPVKAVVWHHDITSRKLLEQQMEAKKEQLQELTEHLEQVLWMTDAKTSALLYMSPACERMFGRSAQSLMDEPESFFTVVHSEDLPLLLCAGATMATTGHMNLECRVRRADGEYRWVWMRGYPVMKEGEVVRLVGMTEDIHQRKQIEEKNAELAAIIEFAEDAIVSVTLDGRVVSWNNGAERLYGYSAREIIGRSALLLIPPEKVEEYHVFMKKTRQGERVAAFDTLRRRKDGKVIPVSLSASAIEVHPGVITGTSKISHDISRVKILEEQFRQAQKMEAIGTLAGGVAHDFNNLLTVINGYAEMILDDLPPDNPIAEFLSEVRKAGDRAVNLTRQLLAFSRMQLLEPKVLDLNAIVRDAQNMLGRLIGEDIILETVLDPALRPVKVDHGQIQQVLMNLALNARDAMPQGGQITIETRQVTLEESYCQTHAETKPGDYAVISVSDSGTGMDEETKSHIFEPFYTTKGPEKGTGLGLAVVHGVVKQSGGHVGVYSELGKGTVFSVYLPIAAEARPAGLAPAVISKMPGGTETILLVEDEDSVRAFCRHILEPRGYTQLVAKNGQEALKLAEDHLREIDLVLSDVVLPHLGGRLLAEKLREMRPGLKILFMSGYTDDAVVRHGILEAEVSFLQKPFAPVALARKVRDVLDETK